MYLQRNMYYFVFGMKYDFSQVFKGGFKISPKENKNTLQHFDFIDDVLPELLKRYHIYSTRNLTISVTCHLSSGFRNMLLTFLMFWG